MRREWHACHSQHRIEHSLHGAIWEYVYTEQSYIILLACTVVKEQANKE